jgi:transcriptional regulator with XRE-family HTH domain
METSKQLYARRLKERMGQLDMSQYALLKKLKDLGDDGATTASLSYYCNAKHFPGDIRRGYIAEALKTPRLYFLCENDLEAEEILRKGSK